MSVIFLFGHRQFAGKDTCCDILEDILLEKNISYYRNSFAKLLKQHASIKYGLNFENMECQEYKKQTPPHLNGKSIREVLIHEGNCARQVWRPVWAWAAYEPILNEGCKVSFISDFRFPNEYDDFDELYELYNKQNPLKVNHKKPRVIKVQVYRPNGIFKNDGADAELPDDFDYWDYNIINEDILTWRDNLKNQLINILEKENVI
jgi:hypothetical protein